MQRQPQPVNILNYIKLPHSVRDCKTDNINCDWLLFEISTCGFSNNTYLIYIATDSSNNIYMNPFTPYTSNEFERLFNFGIQCQNYNDNKVIIVNDTDYYKNFEKYFNK